jgi:hypothetical protein
MSTTASCRLTVTSTRRIFSAPPGCSNRRHRRNYSAPPNSELGRIPSPVPKPTYMRVTTRLVAEIVSPTPISWRVWSNDMSEGLCATLPRS